MTHRGRPRKHLPGDRKVLAVRLPTDIYKRVHHLAIEQDAAVQDVVQAALTMFLARMEKR